MLCFAGPWIKALSPDVLDCARKKGRHSALNPWWAHNILSILHTSIRSYCFLLDRKSADPKDATMPRHISLTTGFPSERIVLCGFSQGAIVSNRALRVVFDRLSSTGFMIVSICFHTKRMLNAHSATVYFWPDFRISCHKSVLLLCYTVSFLYISRVSQGPIWECCFAGGALALQAALSFPHTLAGVCSVGGWASAGIHPAQLKDMPILMCHGYDDSMVPIQVARSSCIGLRCPPCSALEWHRGDFDGFKDGFWFSSF